MYCSTCGEFIDDSRAVFCPNCGSRLLDGGETALHNESSVSQEMDHEHRVEKNSTPFHKNVKSTLNMLKNMNRVSKIAVLVVCAALVIGGIFAITQSGAAKFTFEWAGDGYMITGFSGNAKRVVIPETYKGEPVTSIGINSFIRCDKLTEIVIPDSVITIEFGAIAGCDNLESITISKNVTSIGEGNFRLCPNLVSINVTDDNAMYKSIDGALFSKDGSVLIACPPGLSGSYSVPDGVTTIGDSAFGTCDKLTSIYIPGGVTTIQNHAFESCCNLETINIPDSLTDFSGKYFFSDCLNLTSINVSEDSTVYKSVDGVLFSKDGEVLLICPPGISGSYSVPDDVTAIGECAFQCCENLVSITIPDNVTVIGDCAFEFCSNLISITIPDGVTRIGWNTFSYCENLTSVNISNNVTSIAPNAFDSCFRLSEIKIPNSVTTIDGAFNNISNIIITAPHKASYYGYEIEDGVTWVVE